MLSLQLAEVKGGDVPPAFLDKRNVLLRERGALEMDQPAPNRKRLVVAYAQVCQELGLTPAQPPRQLAT